MASQGEMESTTPSNSNGKWSSMRASGPSSRAVGGGFSGRTVTTSPSLLKSLGSEIETISIDSLTIKEDIHKVENVQYLSSYNWINGSSPIILVPGSPPAWTPPTIDYKLTPDSGEYFRDHNAAKYPSFPTEPAVRSIFALHPKYDTFAVDIVACGNTMGNLLRFARKMAWPFRFDVDVVGNTVFLIRRENPPTQLIENVKGYGHAFPEAYTTWDEEVRNSCSYQRIIEYDFGDLHLVIRSKSDAYLKEPSVIPAKEETFVSLEDVLRGMAVTSLVPIPGQKLAIGMQGEEVSQDQIFDIKTRSSFNTFDMEEILPRFWINQTRKFLLAYHQYGRFNKPQVADVESNVLNWEKDNSAALGRLHALMKRIIDAVISLKDRQAEVSWDGEGPLKITEQTGPMRRVLPTDLIQTWERDEVM